MRTDLEVNDSSIWNEIYEKEQFTPGWVSPGTDYNLKNILVQELKGVTSGIVDFLDIGCGNGRNSMLVEEIEGVSFKYTGVDFAESALDYCRKTYNIDKSFIYMDMTKKGLPLKDEYRVIIDCGCFHSIPLEKRELYINNLINHSGKDSIIVIGAWYRVPEHHETVKPSYFPYLYLDEWFFNKSDMENIMGHAFIVENEYVDDRIYDGINKGFVYFTLRLR